MNNRIGNSLRAHIVAEDGIAKIRLETIVAHQVVSYITFDGPDFDKLLVMLREVRLEHARAMLNVTLKLQ
jgi:hypothetical protein